MDFSRSLNQIVVTQRMKIRAPSAAVQQAKMNIAKRIYNSHFLLNSMLYIDINWRIILTETGSGDKGNDTDGGRFIPLIPTVLCCKKLFIQYLYNIVELKLYKIIQLFIGFQTKQ